MARQYIKISARVCVCRCVCVDGCVCLYFNCNMFPFSADTHKHLEQRNKTHFKTHKITIRTSLQHF